MPVLRWVRRVCFTGALVLAALALVAPLLAPAGAQDDPEAGRPTAFVADAESFATQVVINTVPPQFFAELVNARSPYATSHFETGSTSTAKASMLNPGLAVTGLATLCAAGLPCSQLPNFPPPYPLMADATYPIATDSTAQINGGSLSLGPLLTQSGDAKAHAGRDKVTADATAVGTEVGPGVVPLMHTGTSTATNELAFNGDGDLVATAIAALNDVSILGTLHFDSIEARSISTAKPDGTKSNDVHLDIKGATLAGTPITIGSDGLTIGGSSQGGDLLSGLGKTLTPLLSPFRGHVRTLTTTDQTDNSGATANTTGLAIDITPNTDKPAGVSPTITILLGFAGSHAYAYKAPPSSGLHFDNSGPISTGTGTAGTPGTPGRKGTPAVTVPGTTGSSNPGDVIETIVTSLLSGAAADRMKLFYLAWTLSMAGLALGSRLRPFRLNGGVHRVPVQH